MKKIVLFIVLFATLQFQAQTSSGITYQAVIYNPSGQILPGNNQSDLVLSNKSICLRFSIIDINTQLEYQETISTQTDDFGMVNLIIGTGNQVGGYASNFQTVVWDGANKKMKVEVDLTTSCSTFITISEQFFTTVPFSNYAKRADNVTGIVPITNGGTGATNIAGAKTNLGLNNVDNTSDLNKPISIATQSALNAEMLRATAAEMNLAANLTNEKNRAIAQEALKENGINKSSDSNLGTSDILFPTQNAVKTYVDNQISAGVIDASSSTKGKIKLAGDLSGTADAPLVPGLLYKENTISAGLTSQYWRGDKTWQTLDKSTVGLSNVDNTSDIDKPLSNASQLVLNTKENVSNKSTNILLGSSDILYPTQNAVKTYVDSQLLLNSTPNATLTALGKIQLAGDLGGTANFPTVPGLVGKAPLLSPSFTGTPTAPTPSNGNNSTQIATTEFVSNAIATKQNILNNPITGVGSQNKLAKFQNTGSNLIDSQLFDNGTNIGIGTVSPASKLDVNGSVTNTTAHDASATTTIDFSQSNLAFTTASAGAFTLTNIKTGGTYTLAVQGATAGTSVFSATGFTFKYVNNGVTTANKHSLYTFLVMGTTVYVYLATGF